MKKRILPVLLILTLLLTACQGVPGETQPSTEQTLPPETTAAPTTEPTTEPTAEPTTAPTEPPVLYRNPLTGEPLDAPYEDRPIAVVINNHPSALPHHGIGQAAIVHEILAEGDITRLEAVFTDVRDLEKVGSIRSARTYLIDLAYSYDAILVHSGTSVYADNRLAELHNDHLDGITGAAAPYYYRDQDRLNSGYALEHTLFSTGAYIREFSEKKDYSLTSDPERNYGLNFADDGTPAGGEAAEQITIRFLSGGKTTTMTYNAEDGAYYGTEYGKDFIDGNTGDLVDFENVFVLKADTSVISSYGHRMVTLLGTGDGYFACGGKIVPIVWHHEKDSDPFTYTLTDGTPLTQGVGRTYIAVIPLSGTVEYQ